MSWILWQWCWESGGGCGGWWRGYRKSVTVCIIVRVSSDTLSQGQFHRGAKEVTYQPDNICPASLDTTHPASLWVCQLALILKQQSTPWREKWNLTKNPSKECPALMIISTSKEGPRKCGKTSLSGRSKLTNSPARQKGFWKGRGEGGLLVNILQLASWELGSLSVNLFNGRHLIHWVMG